MWLVRKMCFVCFVHFLCIQGLVDQNTMLSACLPGVNLCDQSDCMFGTGSGHIWWNNCRIWAQWGRTNLVQKTLNYGVVYQVGGFNPAGTPNTVHYPLGLVNTPQNTFRTQLLIDLVMVVVAYCPWTEICVASRLGLRESSFIITKKLWNLYRLNKTSTKYLFIIPINLLTVLFMCCNGF